VAAGVAPAAAAAACRSKAGDFSAADVARIDEIEKETKHDVIAFLTFMEQRIGPSARWLHYGMTSSDVLDTTLGLQLRDAADLLLKGLDRALAAVEKRAFEQISTFYTGGAGYAVEMGTQPQTLYGIADSPIGLAAWIIDHDIWSYKMIARVFDGKSEGLTRDDILDNITLYWLTGTALSSSRLYWENNLAFFDVKNVSIPVAVSVFPDELYPAPKSWTERAYPKLIHYNRLPKGGHFAAWEQPQFLSEELRAGFRSLR